MPERNVGCISTRALTVCYRPASNGVEVVLVRSRHGSWTIPGGRIDPGEKPEQAAIRELREEAGVVGAGGAALVTHVLVIKNVGDLLRPRGSRSPVFLVRAQSFETTHEEWRTPAWFRPPDARAALAKRRIPFTARWRLAALDAAVARLER
jgi:8-oxo-dGTP pyrophosphatase MutT (NUDIX family)